MLRPKTLTHVLSQVMSGGIEGALLLNKEGTLLAFAGYDDKSACMQAALASSMWCSYERSGKQALTEEQLKSYVMVCENGILIVRQVASVLIAIQSNSSVPLGSLKSKINALADYLDQPLRQIANI